VTLTTISELERAIEEAPAAELPGLLGELARLQALAWQRMTAGIKEPAAADEILGVDEAAAYLKVSVDSLYRKRKRVGLGYLDPIDGRLKFPRAELDRYLRRQRRA
jgi:excisionase family DNA binding protein